MNASFQAIRAIGAEFAHQLWLVVFITCLVVGVLLVGILIWLTTVSVWWWLLALPIGVGSSVATAILIVFRLLIRYVRPAQTKQQKNDIKAFVGKLQFASEFTTTPKFLILFRVIRSIAAPKSETYLQEILETKNLQKDFRTIVGGFKK